MISKNTRKKVEEKCKGRCAYCGEKLGKKWTVDHVIPQRNFLFHVKNKFKVPWFLEHLKETDVNHVDNLLPACQSCNNYKSAFDLETFRYELSQLPIRLMKYSTQFKISTRFGMVKTSTKKIEFYFEKIKLYVGPSNKP